MWYSFEVGPVHFLQLSTEAAFGAGSPQYNFAITDIQVRQGGGRKWKGLQEVREKGDRIRRREERGRT